MFVMDSVGANPIKQTHPYVALGSGGNIAESILEGFGKLDSLKEYEALGLAFYTIEMCKHTDLYCSGPVQSGCVGGDDYSCKIYDLTVTYRMDQAVRQTYAAVNTALAKQITKNFDGIQLENLDD